MKVLIIQQKMIGDVLTTSILFEAIKTKYPKAELHYLINSHTFPVVKNNPFIDHFIFSTPEIEKSKWAFFKLIKKIRNEHFDTVIDVYGKLNSNLISLFSQAKIKSSYHKNLTAFIYTNPIKRLKIPENNASLAIENRMKLLECIDIPFSDYRPKIYLTPSEIEVAKRYLESASIVMSQPLYMVSVLGSNDNKTYPAAYLAKLLDALIATQPMAQLLFNYIPKQTVEAREIYKLCLPVTQNQIHFEVFGKNLREFLAMTSLCHAVIGNEGGAINMAKALNIQTFAIFSPYLNVQNWFGRNENDVHEIVHLSEFIEPYDLKLAKQNPKSYYHKFKPEFIIPKLEKFVHQIEHDL